MMYGGYEIIRGVEPDAPWLVITNDENIEAETLEKAFKIIDKLNGG